MVAHPVSVIAPFAPATSGTLAVGPSGPHVEHMSKAFMPEDTGRDEGPVLPSRPAEVQPITPSGHRRLRDERACLVPGDEATRTRAAALDRILATVRVVPPALAEGRAGFGCEVTVEDELGARKSYTIVGPDEIDAAAGKITAESPLGSRLLGARAGDAIELPRGERTVELSVIDVRVPSDHDA